MRLMVIGYAGHGKDTACEILRDHFGLTFESSSKFVGERAVRPYLAKRGITYDSYDAMYQDRDNHRPDWFDAIKAFNEPDAARLGKELYAKFDIYCGLRRREEFLELKRQGVVQWVLWIDASKRLPPEDQSSCTVLPSDADAIVDNNGSLDDLRQNIVHAYSDASWAIYHRRMTLP